MKIFEVGVRGVAFLVFLFPLVISIALGSYVMAEVLNEQGRELHMLPVMFGGKIVITSSEGINIVSLQNEYPSGTPILIKVSIADPGFDCGDLYITLYDLSIRPKHVISQNAFFAQCFDYVALLPIDDEFSETISEPGNYELVVEMNDEQYTKAISTSAKFTVT